MVNTPFHILSSLLTDIRSGIMLNCGLHTCPHRCHQLQDHSKMDCTAIILSTCPKKHKLSRKCHDKAAATCRKCEREAHEQEQRQRRDYELDERRQAQQQAYAAKLAEIQDEIEHQTRRLRDEAEDQDRQRALAQKQQDLAKLKMKVNTPPKASKPNLPSQQQSTPEKSAPSQTGHVESPSSTASSNRTTPSSQNTRSEQDDDWSSRDQSEAKDDWEEQKKLWGAQNDALDSLMSMIGKISLRIINFRLTCRRPGVCERTVSCNQK
jgi:hypothetical protein